MKKYEENAPITIHRNTLLTFSRAGGDLSAEAEVDLTKFIAAEKAETTKGKSNNPIKGATGRFIDMTKGVRGMFEVSAEGTLSFKKTGENISVEPTEVYKPMYPVNESEYQIRLFWEDISSEEAQAANVLVITPDDFPGTFKVIGDALIRSESTGKDEAFQFVISKAKLLSEITLTMQAEGDPSTFSATLNVLRDSKGEMFSLIKY